MATALRPGSENMLDRKPLKGRPESDFPRILSGGRLNRSPQTSNDPRISGPDLDLYGQLEDRRYSLGVCFLGLVIDADGRVERSYFLAPQRAGKETRDLLLDTVQSWRFDPATRLGVPLRVRYILSITDCPYLPAYDP
jgi:hypothetical protein